MFIGVCRLALHLPENSSLKGKRKVVKSIVARVKNKFNVSIAEIEDHDKWQKINIGIATISNDKKHANSILVNIVSFIENLCLAELIDYEIQIL
jgi:uncharacterized protein YlxP (DUF503 family)